MAESRRVVGVEDSDLPSLEVQVGGAYSYTSQADAPDAFNEDMSKVRGLSPATRRKITREMQKQYVGTGGAKSKKKDYYDYVNGYTLFEVVLPPYNLDYLALLFEKSPAHAAAVKAKTFNIVGLGHDFVESEATKKKIDAAEGNDKKLNNLRSKLQDMKVELNDWLDSCNAEDAFAETLIKVWTDYESTGNGYIEVGRKTTGEIGYIGHIPSTTMRIRRERDGFVQIIANQYVYFRNFGDKKTKDPIGNDPRPNEVIHLKKYSPTNSYYGVPDVISAMAAVTGNEFAAKFNLDYFENKAVPRYVIVVKGGNLSPTSEQRMLEFFQTGLKGQNHRTLYVPLPADDDAKKVNFEMKPIEAGIQDSSFDNYRKGNLNDILMAHRVPITKVSVSDAGTALAAARDADKTFKESVTRPEQRVLETKLNKIIKEKTDVFLIKMNELALTDEQTQSTIDEVYLRNQVITPNEVRARKGLPGLKGGDEVLPLSGQIQAENNAQASNSRTRDQQRAQNAPDTQGNARNPKGDGRQQS